MPLEAMERACHHQGKGVKHTTGTTRCECAVGPKSWRDFPEISAPRTGAGCRPRDRTCVANTQPARASTSMALVVKCEGVKCETRPNLQTRWRLIKLVFQMILRARDDTVDD
eukprot:1768081-Pleurochrysis_carterae.AAC.2